VLNNIKLQRNVVFNNGTISRWGAASNLGYYGKDQAQNLVFQDNSLYMSPLSVLQQQPFPNVLAPNLVYRDPNDALPVLNNSGQRSGNYVIGGDPQTLEGDLDDGWQQNVGDIKSAQPFAGTAVRWNVTAADTARAHVAVYSGGPTSVAVTFTNFLNAGDSYEVRNAQNFGAGPVASGVYNGSITLQLTTNPAPPIGAPRPAIVTSPSFTAFVVTRTAAGPLAPPTNCQFQRVPPPPQPLAYLQTTWTNSGQSGVSTEVSIWHNGFWSVVRVEPPGATNSVYTPPEGGQYAARIRHIKTGYLPSNYCNTGSLYI
jgi:hypothetical protein